MYICIYIYLFIYIYIYIYISHVKPSHGVILKGNHITNHQPHFVLTFRLLPFSKLHFYMSMHFHNLQFSYTQFFINIFYISKKGKQLSYKLINSHE